MVPAGATWMAGIGIAAAIERTKQAKLISRARGRPGQARKARLEDAFYARFQPRHLVDQPLELGSRDAAAVDARGKPGTRAPEGHLRRNDDQRDREEDVGAGRQRQCVDRGENEEKAAPRPGVQLSRELGEGQPVGARLGDDLRKPLRKRERAFRGRRRRCLVQRRHYGVSADRGLGPGENRCAEFGGAGGAFGEDSVQLRRVAAKLVEARPDRGNQRDQGVGKRRLECAEALAGEAREHLLDAFVRSPRA